MPSGSYGWITFLQAINQLAARLGDPNFVHWSKEELGTCIIEALQEWQALTGYWRSRGTFTLSPGVAFYDLPSLLVDSGANQILAMSTTDTDVVKIMERHLLEPSTIPWTGTPMFTLDDLTQALQRARDNFLVETGTVVTHSQVAVTASAVGRFPVDDHVIDVRRLAWAPVVP